MLDQPLYPSCPSEYEALQEALAHEAMLESPEHAAEMERAADEADELPDPEPDDFYLDNPDWDEREDRYLDASFEDRFEMECFGGFGDC